MYNDSLSLASIELPSTYVFFQQWGAVPFIRLYANVSYWIHCFSGYLSQWFSGLWISWTRLFLCWLIVFLDFLIILYLVCPLPLGVSTFRFGLPYCHGMRLETLVKNCLAFLIVLSLLLDAAYFQLLKGMPIVLPVLVLRMSPNFLCGVVCLCGCPLSSWWYWLPYS